MGLRRKVLWGKGLGAGEEEGDVDEDYGFVWGGVECCWRAGVGVGEVHGWEG